MEITTAPQALPGHCMFCRSAVREWFIDTMSSIDHDGPMNVLDHVGAIYICNECFKEMALCARWISPDNYENLYKSEAKLLVENVNLTNKVNALEAALRELASVGYDHNVSTDFNTRINTVLEDFESPDSTVPVGTSELGTGTGTLAQQDNDSGVAELRSDDAGDDSLFKLNLG